MTSSIPAESLRVGDTVAVEYANRTFTFPVESVRVRNDRVRVTYANTPAVDLWPRTDRVNILARS